MDNYIGTIEGFFGEPWSWDARRDHVNFLASKNLNFYMYAPKADSYLRKNWKEEFPEDHFERLQSLRRTCGESNVKFGIGFSPFEIFHDFGTEAQQTLLKKLRSIDKLEADVLGILFDDMDGNIQNLAELQANIVNFICQNSSAPKITFCPTYYSFDPILDKVFGERPKNYLEDLNKLLDKNVDIMWTGPKVCSKELTKEHLESVVKLLGRKPLIWDNYPVNDGPKNCKFIFLDAFKNRDPSMKDYISGYMSNPMNQAYLSQIPLSTLANFFENPKDYSPNSSLKSAIDAYDIDSELPKSFNLLEEKGLDNLSENDREHIKGIFSNSPSSLQNEIEDWLDGKYIVGSECLTQ